jgi:subtilisin family serine protease
MMRRQLVVLAAVVLGACGGEVADHEQGHLDLAAPLPPWLQPAPPLTANSSIVARGLDRSEVRVVAMLGGQSVAQAQEAAARRLSRSEKLAIKAQRMSEQRAPRAWIEAAGGEVVLGYQSVLNGLKVRIARDRVALLRQVPGVVDVKPLGVYRHDNVVGVQRLEAPAAWAGITPVHGENVKVAIIDSGIDYTHADFGGPGTSDAYQGARATDAEPADPTLFGPAAPRIKGGIDLAGDAYDAGGDEAASTPMPDPNPLDCDGHGTHVTGTLAGSGVLLDGTTYPGPYDQSTYANQFAVGPGVAPAADLYAVRVFGCGGTTDLIPEALEWAIDNDMDVVNMSIASDFTGADDAAALAADAAVAAGIVVVSAAGNGGSVPYITGSPGSSRKGLAVAASLDLPTVPTALVSLPAVGSKAPRAITAINANGVPFPGPTAMTALVLRAPDGSVSLGCNPDDYAAQGAAGKVVVVQRGTCARTARAIFGQQAGAVAVIMINSTSDLPPFEGDITSNPDSGELFDVTIPFLGVRGLVADPSSDGAALVLRDGEDLLIDQASPMLTGLASFTSMGPRNGDGALKPDVAAPGQGIVSALVGSGHGATVISGTSMATPFVAGAAALAIQTHPTWAPAAIKAAIINSGRPDQLGDYSTVRAGSGEIDAASAAGTLAYAYGDTDQVSVSFGIEELKRDTTGRHAIHVVNDAASAVTFDVSVTRQQGSPHTAATSTTQLKVPAHGTRSFQLAVTVPAATAGDSTAFRDVAGLVTLTPTTPAANGGIALRVPYYMVPRATSNLVTKLPRLTGSPPSATATVTNRSDSVPGTADFYAWGIAGVDDGLGPFDVRAVGAASFDLGTDRVVVFAVDTFAGWATPEGQQFDIFIDSDGDGAPNYVVFNIDLGLLSGSPTFNGQIGAVIEDLVTGHALSADFLAAAPTNGSTTLLPVLASHIGLSADNPRFTYSIESFDFFGTGTDVTAGTAGFNAFTGAITTGQFLVLNPDDTQTTPVAIDPTEFAVTPPLGLMVVTLDDKSGPKEGDLIRVRF